MKNYAAFSRYAQKTASGSHGTPLSHLSVNKREQTMIYCEWKLIFECVRTAWYAAIFRHAVKQARHDHYAVVVTHATQYAADAA